MRIHRGDGVDADDDEYVLVVSKEELHNEILSGLSWKIQETETPDNPIRHTTRKLQAQIMQVLNYPAEMWKDSI